MAGCRSTSSRCSSGGSSSCAGGGDLLAKSGFERGIEDVLEAVLLVADEPVERHDEGKAAPELARRHRVETPAAKLPFDRIHARGLVLPLCKRTVHVRDTEHHERLAVRRDQAPAAVALTEGPEFRRGGRSIGGVHRGQRCEQQGGEEWGGCVSSAVSVSRIRSLGAAHSRSIPSLACKDWRDKLRRPCRRSGGSFGGW